MIDLTGAEYVRMERYEVAGATISDTVSCGLDGSIHIERHVAMAGVVGEIPVTFSFAGDGELQAGK